VNAPIIPRGKPVDLFKTRYQNCRHIHVSGRQCGSKVRKEQKAEDRFCDAHSVNKGCTECESMKQTFIPPKGW
jgi:hypothetical protein